MPFLPSPSVVWLGGVDSTPRKSRLEGETVPDGSRNNEAPLNGLSAEEATPQGTGC